MDSIEKIAEGITRDVEKMVYHGEVILDLDDLEKRISIALREAEARGLEKAKAAFQMNRFHMRGKEIHFNHGCVSKEEHERELKEAVKKEREECAKECEEHCPNHPDDDECYCPYSKMAKEIRERTN